MNKNWSRVSLCALLGSNRVSPAERVLGFQLRSQSGPRSRGPVTGCGMHVEGQKPGVPFKKYMGETHSGSDLFGTF